MSEQSYRDWQPLICSESESYAFFHGWKTKHIEILDPQPDLVSRGVPYISQEGLHRPIIPTYPKSPVHYFLQEPFRITRPIKVNELGHRTTFVFHMHYKHDDHRFWRTIDSRNIETFPEFKVNHWYPHLAMPKYLARKKFMVNHVELKHLNDISEQEARDSGVKRFLGGYFYQDYRHENDRNAEYLKSAFRSLRTQLDVLARDKPANQQIFNDPYVFSISFRQLRYMGKEDRGRG